MPDAGLWREVIIALTVGLLSVTSPCVVPLLCGTVPFIGGGSLTGPGEKDGPGLFWRLFPPWILAFLAGFGLVSTLLGLPALRPGYWLWEGQFYMRALGALMLVVNGLRSTGVIRDGRFFRFMGLAGPPRPPDLADSLLIGMGLGAAWSPCPGMVLMSIMILAGSSGNALLGGALVAAWFGGLLAVLFLGSLALHHFFDLLSGRPGVGLFLRRLMGLGMVGFGFLMFFNRLGWLRPDGAGWFSL